LRSEIRLLPGLQEEISALRRELSAARSETAALREETLADAYVVTESFNYIDGCLREVCASQDQIKDRVNELNRRIGSESALTGKTEPAQLNAEEAEFMNRATGYNGFAASANLWFNPPVIVNYRKGGIELDQVHERILETPFVFAGLHHLAPNAHILDVGSNESTIAVSLATLGYQVTALDMRAYPFSHPNLCSVVADIQSWGGPAHPLDAVFCISTLEHLGLKCYGNAAKRPDLDQWALQQFRRWLKPGGLLTLTVPYGVPRTTPTERIYGDEFIDSSFHGWNITDRQVYVQTSPCCWTPMDEKTRRHDTWQTGTRGVLLLRAVKKQVEA
jgi:SAM-dependent methyltransferase